MLVLKKYCVVSIKMCNTDSKINRHVLTYDTKIMQGKVNPRNI